MNVLMEGGIAKATNPFTAAKASNLRDGIGFIAQSHTQKGILTR